MKLRKYLYLDEKFINDAFAAINGFDYDQKSIEQEETYMLSELDSDADRKEKLSKAATTIAANISISSKLQSVIDYVAKDNNGELPFYESADMGDSKLFRRELIFEGQFNISFTKIETWGNIASGIEKLDLLFNAHKTDDVEAVKQLQELAKHEREKGLPCILSFVNYPTARCFAYLDESSIKVNKANLKTEATVLCKIVRIIKKGESVCLTDLSEYFDMVFPDTKEGKRKKVEAIKNGKMKKIKEFEDRIDGPTFEVIPIAIYK